MSFGVNIQPIHSCSPIRTFLSPSWLPKMVCGIKGKLQGSGRMGAELWAVAWVLTGLRSHSWSPWPCWHQLLRELTGKLMIYCFSTSGGRCLTFQPLLLHLYSSHQWTWEHFRSQHLLGSSVLPMPGVLTTFSSHSLPISPLLPLVITWPLTQCPLACPWLSIMLLSACLAGSIQRRVSFWHTMCKLWIPSSIFWDSSPFSIPLSAPGSCLLNVRLLPELGSLPSMARESGLLVPT